MKDFYNLGAAYLEKCKLEHPSPELCRALKRHVFGDLWDKWNTDRKWRERRAADAGIELPSIELLSPPTGTSSRIAYHSLVTPLEQEPPPCISRGSAAIHHEPCNCGSAAKIPVFPCSIHKRCVLTSHALAKIKDTDARNSLRACTECPDRNVPAWNITDITACITVYKRYDALDRLKASIRKFYPELKVIHQDTESNPSWGRNQLAARCETPLLLLLEEDFVFTERTDLFSMLEVLNGDLAMSMVVGSVCEPAGKTALDRSRLINTAWDFRRDGELCQIVPASAPWKFVNGVRYQPCQFGLNFSLSRRQVMMDVPWEETIPIGEHAEWFWRVHQAGIKTAFIPEVVVNHFRDHSGAEYKAHRNRNFTGRIQAKHGFRFEWRKSDRR